MSQITKKALAQALASLMDEKPLSKITISDITNKAGVNRHTFYYHFKDINDMIAWIFSTTANEILESKVSYAMWTDGFRDILSYIVDHKKYMFAVYHSNTKDYLLRFFNEWTYSLIREVLEEQSAGMKVSVSDKDYIASFYTFGFVGILTRWIDNGMIEKPDEMVDQLEILVRGDFKDALSKFENKVLNYRQTL